MKAFFLDAYGKKQPLRLGEAATPEPAADEVLVRVHAAGVNMLDAKIRRSEFKLILPYHLPLILGHDVAGLVLRVGARVTRFKPGDAVYARPADRHIGAFAECIAIKEAELAHKPASLSMEEAAALPLVGLTAWQALVDKAQLRPGQKVFIQAGSGGVGTVAIQLAKHLGAFVATTTSTANVEWVKRLGVDLVIDYTQEDFASRLHDYDVVLNSQDSATLDKSLGVLKPGGRLISISGPPDADFADAIGASWWLKALLRLISLHTRRLARCRGVEYSFLFMRADGAQLQQLGALVDAGILHPVVDRIFAFEATQEALDYVETGRAKGKVVVRM